MQEVFFMAKKNAKTRRVEFKYNNGEASSVVLVGDFNSWDQNKNEMKKSKDGAYHKILMLPPGKYEYKFLVDGQWKNDPLNKNTTKNCFETLNNVIEVR